MLLEMVGAIMSWSATRKRVSNGVLKHRLVQAGDMTALWRHIGGGPAGGRADYFRLADRPGSRAVEIVEFGLECRDEHSIILLVTAHRRRSEGRVAGVKIRAGSG